MCVAAKPFQQAQGFVALFPGHKQMIVMEAGNHIAGNPRGRERGGNGSGQANRLEIGMHAQCDPRDAEAWGEATDLSVNAGRA